MFTIVLIFHILVVIGLMAVILVQRGRSGGLVEALGGVESIFGTKTSAFFVKVTIILAILFFVTSIFLAYLSKEKSKSLMDKYSAPAVEKKETTTQPSSTTPAANETQPEVVPAQTEVNSEKPQDTKPVEPVVPAETIPAAKK